MHIPVIKRLTEVINERETGREQINSGSKKAGGIAPKFVSPGFAGMPDRLILLPDGHIAFAELKAPGKLPRPLQLSRHRLLQRLGFKVYVIDDPEQIGGMLNEIRTT